MWGIAGGGSCTGGPTGGTRCCVLVCGAWRKLWRTVCEEREPWGRWSWVRGAGGGGTARCGAPARCVRAPRCSRLPYESAKECTRNREKKKRVSLSNLDAVCMEAGALVPYRPRSPLSRPLAVVCRAPTSNVVESCEKCCHAQFLAEAECHLLRALRPGLPLLPGRRHDLLARLDASDINLLRAY